MNLMLNDNGKFADLENRRIILTEVLSKNYLSIGEVNLCTGNAIILKSTEDSELEGCQLPWNELLQRYARHKAYPEDQGTVLSLTLNKLENLLAEEREELTAEIRSISENGKCNWVEIAISVISIAEKRLLVTIRNIDENRMLKNIVDTFVYQNMDYFVLLDASHNSYHMFNGKKDNVVLPPSHSNDYTTEMIEYNKQHVVAEDFERVTANMQIPHVLRMLEEKETYTFTSGGLSIDGDYRRSQVQFQYYDKVTKLILLTRIDITQSFMDEQFHNKQLATALQDAQHDSLTGIYTQKTTANLVASSLECQYHKGAALLFIDVDNFKMINDTLGHQKGDELLCFLASSIQILAGHSGIAGRIGGDEFLLFLPVFSSAKDMEYYAEKICQIFDSLSDPALKNLPISCSVGISTYPHDGTDYDTLVRKADQALYTSKRYGKKQFYFYSNN